MAPQYASRNRRNNKQHNFVPEQSQDFLEKTMQIDENDKNI
jgi:hypothetical protein